MVKASIYGQMENIMMESGFKAKWMALVPSTGKISFLSMRVSGAKINNMAQENKQTLKQILPQLRKENGLMARGKAVQRVQLQEENKSDIFDQNYV